VVGRAGGHGYLYEIEGDSDELPSLWLRVVSGYRSLTLNLPRGSAAQSALAAHGEVSWLPQRLAMWLPLAEPRSARCFGDWYIPYLDRI
jgi:hypothetical protein